jgi:hypothetical protein
MSRACPIGLRIASSKTCSPFAGVSQHYYYNQLKQNIALRLATKLISKQLAIPVHEIKKQNSPQHGSLRSGIATVCSPGLLPANSKSYARQLFCALYATSPNKRRTRGVPVNFAKLLLQEFSESTSQFQKLPRFNKILGTRLRERLSNDSFLEEPELLPFLCKSKGKARGSVDNLKKLYRSLLCLKKRAIVLPQRLFKQERNNISRADYSSVNAILGNSHAFDVRATQAKSSLACVATVNMYLVLCLAQLGGLDDYKTNKILPASQVSQAQATHKRLLVNSALNCNLLPFLEGQERSSLAKALPRQEQQPKVKQTVTRPSASKSSLTYTLSAHGHLKTLKKRKKNVYTSKSLASIHTQSNLLAPLELFVFRSFSRPIGLNFLSALEARFSKSQYKQLFKKAEFTRTPQDFFRSGYMKAWTGLIRQKSAVFFEFGFEKNAVRSQLNLQNKMNMPIKRLLQTGQSRLWLRKCSSIRF